MGLEDNILSWSMLYVRACKSCIASYCHCFPQIHLQVMSCVLECQLTLFALELLSGLL
ncbi:hypothetical protein OIU84_007312 [Salix udensis]|uniref:Uncharacterized protein n=1 Tax=Salix udensis TaxID=889485 RepID=A0AAD6JTC0_9ROSI|nr:hypothetical protein OIU84_007312 [Salix udensis]